MAESYAYNDAAATPVDFDMNDFVNFDSGFVASPTISTMKIESQHPSDPRATMQQDSSQQRLYHGPSHDYGQFRQQTGLPVGAVSHVKAVNAYSNQTRPTNSVASTFPSYNSGLDLDFEAGSSSEMPAYFYPADPNTEDYVVDPRALAPDAQPMNITRAWPGMHSHQAKAEAAAKQAEAAAQQQREKQQLRLQQPLPTNFEQSFGNNGSDRAQSHNTSEPEVNDQIARLLDQMRHNSDTGSHLDDDTSSNAGDASYAARMKKDEEDMDEDERLLASEEGKKLTSKERRQLRNKVSARAFRSRRKEYITQLEGEVAVKANECDDLKRANRQLMEQNQQLTQLTRAMLAHPAFNSFMQDMSNDPSHLHKFNHQPASAQRSEAYQHQQPQQQDQTQTETTHVGMSMMPENNLDLSMLNLGANHWVGGNFHQPQIFAVHELPQGPSLDELSINRLSGKSDEENYISEAPSSAKLDMPTQVIELPAAASESRHVAETSFDDFDVSDDPCFALYVDSPSMTSPVPPPGNVIEGSQYAAKPLLSNKPPLYSLQVVSLEDDTKAMKKVDRMFASLEPAFHRIAAMTSTLPP